MRQNVCHKEKLKTALVLFFITMPLEKILIIKIVYTFLQIVGIFLKYIFLVRILKIPFQLL